MGTGYLFKCKNCKKRYSVQLGIGMMFPEVCRETLDDMENGEYGEELQKLCKETPYAAVNVEREMFMCDKCGNWKVSENLSLYAPNDPEQIRAKQYGIKTVDEWGYVPYVTSLDLEQDYHLLKEYRHICSKCGSVMKKIDDDNIPGILPCPYCGTDNGMEPSIMLWD